MKIFILLVFVTQICGGFTAENPKLAYKQFVSSPEEAAIVVHQYQQNKSDCVAESCSKIIYALKELNTDSIIVRDVLIPKLTFNYAAEKPKTASEVIDEAATLKPWNRLPSNGFIMYSTD